MSDPHTHQHSPLNPPSQNIHKLQKHNQNHHNHNHHPLPIHSLQSFLSQHANQPINALNDLINQFNHLHAQLADDPLQSNNKLVSQIAKLQDENRQLWALIGKSKADAKDLKQENKDLKQRLAQLELQLAPTAPITHQNHNHHQNTLPITTPTPSASLSLSHSDPTQQPSLDLGRLNSSPRKQDRQDKPDKHQTQDSQDPPPKPADSLKSSPTLHSRSSHSQIHLSNQAQTPAPSPKNSLSAHPRITPLSSPLDIPSNPLTCSSPPQLNHIQTPSRSASTPSHDSALIPLDHYSLPLSPKLRRKASSVDISNSTVDQPLSHSISVPSVSNNQSQTPFSLPTRLPDSLGNRHHHPLPSTPKNNHFRLSLHPSSMPSYSSRATSHHSIVPPEVRQYMLTAHTPTTPVTPVWPMSSHRQTTSSVDPSSESRPALPTVQPPSAELSHRPHSPLPVDDPPAVSPTQRASLPNLSSSDPPSLSATNHNAPAVQSAPQRTPRPTPSPTNSQNAPLPADPVYATQPTTKRRMLTPTFLPFTQIKVTNSHIRANERSKEVISFFINISVIIPPESDPERKGAKANWVVEKLYSDVLTLDHLVKSKHSKTQNKALAQLPDRALFKDHAPSKVDARKAVLQKYLQSLCAAQLKEKTDVCDFFNSNIVINERSSTPNRPGFMQGYLTKKGRNFGGWQTRFYVLEGPILEYFDTRGGNRLGHIVITGAQIGRQQQRTQEATDDSYRHAFLIRMHKREKEGEIDHILCAETDEERDAWVDALTCYVTGRYVSADGPSTSEGRARRQASFDGSFRGETPSLSQHTGPSFEQRSDGAKTPRLHGRADSLTASLPASHSERGLVAPALTVVEESPALPRRKASSDQPGPDNRELLSRSGSHSDPRAAPTPRPPPSRHLHSSPQQQDQNQTASDAESINASSNDRPNTPDSQQRPKISGPMNGAPIVGGYRIKPPEEKKAKFRSAFWGFTGRTSAADRKDVREGGGGVAGAGPTPFAPAPRPVFGVSLQEAVSVARVHEKLDLPAVVFRCVEFLEAKGAIEEEGIYRLSGSSVNIKQYKERFNTEGDFNLLEASREEYHDVHAVAGLLKQFLRELSSPILTRELHGEFLKVIDLSHRSDKVNELGRLCAELPLPNYTLLRFLSAHLIHIVENEDVNKMSMRNVGIVFSPTLGMPAPLFALLLKEFDLIFNIEGDSRAPIKLPGPSEEDSTLTHQSAAAAGAASSGGVAGAASMANKRISRNSMLYSATGADVLMEHSRLSRTKGTAESESESEVEYESSSEPDEALLAAKKERGVGPAVGAGKHPRALGSVEEPSTTAAEGTVGPGTTAPAATGNGAGGSHKKAEGTTAAS